jgi:hypothetical protein
MIPGMEILLHWLHSPVLWLAAIPIGWVSEIRAIRG